MPELPEVETTRRGVEPHVLGRQIVRVDVRERRLRWPVPDALSDELPGSRFTSVGRRAKYLLFQCGSGVLLVHLGMSGSLRLVPANEPPSKHAHVDIVFDSGTTLRFTDPRKFGSVLWHPLDSGEHPLLQGLGPEPFGDEFSGTLLYYKSRGRKTAVKNLIMDSRVVVGVGNIYASEALFLAGIHPARNCGRISLGRYDRLSDAIRTVLGKAICAGGTSLRDFTGSDGKPGYFELQLNVYGRVGKNCLRCSAELRGIRQGQRSTVYCPNCQT